MGVVPLLLVSLGLYAAAGLFFGVAFVLAGAGRVDPSARGAPVGFRLMILPGAAALWPVLALRWRRARLAGRGVSQ